MLLPALSFLAYGAFSISDSIIVFFPFIKEKYSALQHTECDHLWEQRTRVTQDAQSIVANGWEGYMPLRLLWLPKVCCECVFSPPQATVLQQTMPGTQGYFKRYNCLWGSMCASSVTWCQLKILGQEQSVGARISQMSFASGRTQSWSYTLSTKQASGSLHICSITANCEKRAVATKEKGLHILPCYMSWFCLVFFFP